MEIEHVAIWTRDLKGLKTFYEAYFQAKAGVKYSNPATGLESYFLTFPAGARIELMCLPSLVHQADAQEAPWTGYAHLAFSVGSREAVDTLTARLRADGHRVLDNPRYTGDGYYEASALDPDGNRLELTT